MIKSILILISILSISQITAQTDNRLKGIEKELNNILEVTQAAGFAVAVVEGDKVLYAKGFGYSDYENKTPVDQNTLFAIGSCTKAFTSAILGKLRGEEKLSFDDSPHDYIPELAFYNNDMNNDIIIKDLMRHSTGIPRHDISWLYFPTQDKDSLIQRIKYQEPFTGVRQQWHYNNFMFLVQGVIAEKITGESWEDNVRNQFFKPLEMTRSNVSIAEMETAKNAAIGYQLINDSIISKTDYYDLEGMAPAGAINSSVNDMSKWLISWINNGKFQDREIFPEPYALEAISSQMVVSGALPDKKTPDLYFSNYGYGWFLSSYKGHYRVEHGGNINGFSANVAFYPIDSIGIVVLTNQSGSAVTNLVRNTVADRMLGAAKTDWTKRYVETQIKAKEAQAEANLDNASAKVENTKPSHNNPDYTGSYVNLGYGKFEIVSKNDSLFASIPNNDLQLYLNHYHYDVFELLNVEDGKIDTTGIGTGLKVIFNTNSTGDIGEARLQLEAMVDPITFKRTPKSIAIDAETLNQYVGEYEVSGLPIKVYVKNGETLFVFVEGQPEYELIATGKHKFSFKTLEGYKVEFTEAADQSINEIVLIQPNGVFKAARK